MEVDGLKANILDFSISITKNRHDLTIVGSWFRSLSYRLISDLNTYVHRLLHIPLASTELEVSIIK